MAMEFTNTVIVREAKARPAKIMVADDEPDLVAALSSRLKSEGYEVVAVKDACCAILAVLRERPDLIILDIGMPGGGGHFAARRLAEIDRTLPIIFLTGRCTPMDRQQAKATGAVEYITKPFCSVALIDAVRRALPT